MFWYKIAEWFRDISERQKLVNSFNQSAKEAFIHGYAPTLLKASFSKGDRAYKHQFSHFMYSGCRIKALSGRALTKNELTEIGKVILCNQELVRRFVALGWDTLEVHSSEGLYGVKWPFKDFANIGVMLPESL